jgi:hypothetical protein
MAKRSISKKQVSFVAKRLAKFLVTSQLLTLFLALCVVGYVVGVSAHPNAKSIPYEELFDGMSVVSHRESPTDLEPHFFVELAAGGKVFSRYDVDGRRFIGTDRGRRYSRAISNTRYPPLEAKSHVDEGFWLELSPSRASLLPGQFEQLYKKTLDYVKPLSFVSTALGTLSGYSVGYRLATWQYSLHNPAVQQRVLETPGIGNVITREAWRRVLLEPVMMSQDDATDRFQDVNGTQRLYTNFFKLAIRDSDEFIPREAARLDSLGRKDVAYAMRYFTIAVRRAGDPQLHLRSADFAAIEQWASLLDRRGHWATDAIPPAGAARMQYYGTLTWYGIAPAPAEERRLWVGPRVLVREGDTEGFVADEILNTSVGCPLGWRELLQPEQDGTSNGWLAQWTGGAREFGPVVRWGRRMIGKIRTASTQ